MAFLRPFVLVIVIGALAASSLGQSSGSGKGNDKKRDNSSSVRSRNETPRSTRPSPQLARPSASRSAPKQSPISRIATPTQSRPGNASGRSQDPIGRVSSPSTPSRQDPIGRVTSPGKVRTSPSTPLRQDPIGKVTSPGKVRTSPGTPTRQDPIGKVASPTKPRTNPGSPVIQVPGKGSRTDRPDQGRNTAPPRVRETPGKRDGESGVLGKTNYRSSNNLFGLQPGFDRGSVVIERAPILGRGGLPELVLREERRWRDDRNRRGGMRRGYWQYDSRWRDDRFYYPHYAFDPYSRRCTISPWYYYPQLPAYILLERIVYVDSHRCDFNEGDDYRWARYDDFDRDQSGSYGELDRAVQDIVHAFERQDTRALGRVVSRSSRVGIWVDGRYSYSLNSDDFYDLMQDNIRGTSTSRYDVRSVRRTRDGATVTARHTFYDSWGGHETITHRYKLNRDHSGYYITDFETSRDW